ncbi:MAG: PRC and DUF2382 domain-containing protein [Mobilicoccus sp.]|nr:PRC and DUF2382 domain-containing protein [Mobilicoccus sp.]
MFGNDMTQDQISALHDANVVDQNGDKVGSVGQIYLDDQTNRPTWVTVKAGFFGTNETFVPLNEASRDGDDIRVPYTKDFIKDAPNMDADHHISEQEEDELYRYYNLSQDSTHQGERRDDAAVGAAGTAGAAGERRDHVEGDRRDHVDADRRDERRDHVDGDRRDDAGSVVRHEEELNVGKERVETGKVRLRKHVVTEKQSVDVPVEREEVHVTREPVRDGETGGRIADGDENVEVTLHADRAVVDKETVAKERVGLDKDVVRDTETVTDEVRKEQVEVERDGDVVREDRDGRTDRDDRV